MGAVEMAAALAASRRACRLYPPEHPTHREALGEFVRVVNESVDVRPLVLNLREGRLYEGSQVLQDSSPATRSLAEAMELRRVESMTFHMGFTETDGEGISQVLGMRPSPDLHVPEELEARGVRAVTVHELEDNSAREIEERDRQRESDRALFRRALTAIERTRTAFVQGTEPDSAEIERTLAPLLERILRAPDALIAVAQTSGHGEPWRFHAMGVAVFAMALGSALGLSDRHLLDLGRAAALHDFGLVISGEAEEETLRLNHPWLGSVALGPIADENCAALLVAYEHHMGVDGSGWPERQPGYAMHPFTKIVAVADRYDSLTRPSEGLGMRPDEAVARLLHEGTNGPLDPLVTRVFASVLGVLPVGCISRLSDFSVAVVASPGADQLRPSCRVVLDPEGTELKRPVDIDLAESDLEIAEVLPAPLLGLQPSDYL
jgi:HD-GYP domain-containing protein (c-di-GMP phosphodiesterase class II)